MFFDKVFVWTRAGIFENEIYFFSTKLGYSALKWPPERYSIYGNKHTLILRKMAFLNRGLKTQLFSGAHQQYTVFFLFFSFEFSFFESRTDSSQAFTGFHRLITNQKLYVWFCKNVLRALVMTECSLEANHCQLHTGHVAF